MLSFSTLRSRLLPSQIFQCRVVEVACSAFFPSGPQSNTNFRALTRQEQPSRTLCSLVGQVSSKERTRMASNDAPHEVSEQAEKTLYFGKFKIDPTEVFFTTQHSFAFVNLKPVVPGHVLVSPKRVVHRFLDLTPEEASDLWLAAQQVGRKIEPFFKATSLTFAVQDGSQAGQTVPHVHVHILPRKKGDFENNDEVYDVIDAKEKELSEKLDLDKERKDRTFDEMAAEAAELRALF